jgi:hypothetical protein
MPDAIPEYHSDAGKSAPPRQPVAVSPSDSAPLTRVARAFWVGTAGDVKLGLVGGGSITLPNAAAGVWHGLEGINQVYLTGTEPTEIVVGF